MIKQALRLSLCLLAIAALSTGSARAAENFNFGYSQTGTGGTMDLACSNAIQKIKNNCDFTGPITTEPISCKPLRNAEGQIIGQVCTCEATTTACGRYIGF